MGVATVPPFHQIGEYLFQDLCRDLFDREPTVATAEVYGERGETQHGIDLLAYRPGSDGIEVGQCKAYRDFPPAKIKKASDEFIEHWETRWRPEGVKRFILFVGCSLDQTQRQKQIAEERKRFQALGIEYEAWSAKKLRSNLGPHRDIVGRYCRPAEVWVPEICGVPWMPSGDSLPSRSPSAARLAILESQFDFLAEHLSGERREQLEVMRERWREGKNREVRDWVSRQRTPGAAWTVLPPDVQASILRFDAIVGLDAAEGVARAEKLADEADALHTDPDEQVLRSLIAYRTQDVQRAIECLDSASTIRAANLRAALQLVAGQLTAASETLSAAGTREDVNAETFRLTALLHLGRGDLDLARLAIQKALERSPRWAAVRQTSAMVDYYSALAPSAPRLPLGGWPEPIDWMLVRVDDESRERLQRAASTFIELATELDDGEERSELEAWEVACLANDSARQEEAITRCRTLLASRIDHYRVVAWIAARRYPIDLGKPLAAIEARIQDGTLGLDAAVALVGTYVATRRPKRAARLLERTRPLFHEYAADENWEVLCAQVTPQSRSGRFEIGEQADTELARVKHLVALRASIRKRGGAGRLAEFLRDVYARTSDVRYLLERCQVLAGANDWKTVAGHADDLMARVGTAEAVRLAAYATFNSGQHAKSLSLLDTGRHVFAGSILPIDLRHLRVVALERVGHLPQAAAEAEEMARSEASTPNLLRLAELYVLSGDFLSLTAVARELRGRNDLPRAEALRLAARVHLEDLGLAQALWRKAAAGDVPDDLVGPLVGLAFEFRLEHDAAPFVRRMHKLGVQGQGDIRAISIDDFVKMATEWREHTERVLGAYQRGEVPIHFVAQALNRPLSHYYRRIPRTNRENADPHQQFAILTRHGRRSAPTQGPPSNRRWKLHLDITAILTAADLEILDAVEATFKPLHIPRDLQPALIRMREQTAEHQASLLDSAREILRLLADRECEAYEPGHGTDLGRGPGWTALLEAARRDDGYVADYLPLLHFGTTTPLEGPEDSAHHIVNCRAIVDSLRASGALSAPDAEIAIQRLGSEGRLVDGVPLPRPDSALYCYGTIAETLGSAGLLRATCRAFRVRIEASEVERCHEVVRAHDENQADAHWLANLIERIREGIHDGRYAVLPQAPTASNEDGDAEDERDPSIRGLLDLLRVQLGEGDALWVDDRYTTGFLRVSGAAVIGVIDVLRALRNLSSLDDHAYDQALHRLRTGNIRHVPLRRREIFRRLAEAVITNGKLLESEPLRAMRRYQASEILQGDRLQRGPIDESGALQGELPVLLEGGRAVTEAICELWRNGDLDEETRRVRADWLLEALYADRHALAAAAKLGEGEAYDRRLVASGLAGLLIQVIDLCASESDDAASPRQRYFEWLDSRILRRSFEADPNLISLTATIFRDVSLSLVVNDPISTPRGAVAARTMQRLYDDLPTSIRDEVSKDADFMSRIGITMMDSIRVSTWNFEWSAFWQAGAAALAGRETSLTALAIGTRLIFRPHFVDGRAGFACQHPDTGETHTLAGPEIDLLLESPEARDSALRRVPHWFELPKDKLRREIARIASLDDRSQRVAEALQWRNCSAEVFYRSLTSRLRAASVIDLTDFMPPDGTALLRHFGLSDHPDAAAPSRRRDVATQLVESVGLTNALWRMMSLPSQLPSVLVDEYARLSNGQQRQTLKDLLHRGPTPIARLHLAFLLLRGGERAPANIRLARWLLKSLLTPTGRLATDAFIACLGWVSDRLTRWPDAQRWPANLRLVIAWGHAHQLFSALVAANLGLSQLNRIFSEHSLGAQPEWFEREPDYWRDVAHPRRVHSEPLLLAGFDYAVSETAAPEVLDQELQDALVQVLMRGKPDERFPAPDLLLDISLAGNLLNSFLAGEREARGSRFLGDVVAGLMSPAGARASAVHALQYLAEHDDLTHARSAWVQVFAILGDLPPTDELRPLLGAALRAADFAALCDEDTISALFAAHVSASLAAALGDEAVRAHLAEQLVRLAQVLSRQQADTSGAGPVWAGASVQDLDEERAVGGLLRAALNVWVGGSRTAAETVSAFAGLAERLANSWPSQSTSFCARLRYIADELPPHVSRPLWMVILQLRTR